MIKTIIDFLKTDIGSSIVKWVLSVGMPVLILMVWVYRLDIKQTKTEQKVDNLNSQIFEMYRYQTDTLSRQLARNTQILEFYKKVLE